MCMNFDGRHLKHRTSRMPPNTEQDCCAIPIEYCEWHDNSKYTVSSMNRCVSFIPFYKPSVKLCRQAQQKCASGCYSTPSHNYMYNLLGNSCKGMVVEKKHHLLHTLTRIPFFRSTLSFSLPHWLPHSVAFST